MKPDDFIQWLEERIDDVQDARENTPYVDEPRLCIGKGGQLTAFKQVLDYYRKHAVTLKFE